MGEKIRGANRRTDFLVYMSIFSLYTLCAGPGLPARPCRASPACRWGGPGTARRSGRAGMDPTQVEPCRAWAEPKCRAVGRSFGPRVLCPSILVREYSILFIFIFHPSSRLLSSLFRSSQVEQREERSGAPVLRWLGGCDAGGQTCS
uniref:Uncharacterized protein n=1 Tax=Oryza sativa subsp. japonica TaxID=39947 RepID=Q7EYK1_ORYSJ|nr:hypothetical protein [Oryza sativa Japonica Group]BAD30809.1 hypothetical protein [Oryza sativa Japonica Group]